MASKNPRRTFGLLEPRRSAVTGAITSWRARYVGPDTEKHGRSFGDKMAAAAWLNDERILIDRGEWKPPKVREREARLAERRAITLAGRAVGREQEARDTRGSRARTARPALAQPFGAPRRSALYV